MNIGWTTIEDGFDLLFEKPSKVSERVAEEYDNTILQHCLGVNDLWKNIFSVKLPFDLKITYDEKSQKVLIDEDFTDVDVNAMISIITNDTNAYTKNPIIQIALLQFLSTDKQCLLTVMPPIFELDKNPMWQYIRLISGTLNTYDWHRDINFSFEWLDTSKPIIIKKDTPILYLKFNSENLNESFTMKRLKFDGKIKESYTRCVKSRDFIKRNTRWLLKRNKDMRPKHIVDTECPFSKATSKIKFWKK
jgi:hypothetical protein